MLPYIITYIFLVLLAIFERKNLVTYFFYMLIIVYLVLFNGLRYQVGGDWFNYSGYFDNFLPYMSLKDVIFHDDPGYWLLAYFMYKLDLNMIGVDFIVAIIFFVGLYRLLKYQPFPVLGLAVAFPYLIVVVSMGYVRQAAAIGLIMLGISYLEKRKFVEDFLKSCKGL